MPLYSFFVHFSDFTVGIKQIEADTLRAATSTFVETAECLSEYDRGKLAESAYQFLQFAQGEKGLWNWNIHTEDYEVDILGGFVAQADPSGPIRDN